MQARATCAQLKVVEGVCPLGACTIVVAVHSQHERHIALFIYVQVWFEVCLNICVCNVGSYSLTYTTMCLVLSHRCFYCNTHRKHIGTTHRPRLATRHMRNYDCSRNCCDAMTTCSGTWRVGGEKDAGGCGWVGSKVGRE